jgi:hypothetical protein
MKKYFEKKQRKIVLISCTMSDTPNTVLLETMTLSALNKFMMSCSPTDDLQLPPKHMKQCVACFEFNLPITNSKNVCDACLKKKLYKVKCSKCRCIKNIEDFYKHNSAALKISNQCKECELLNQSTWKVNKRIAKEKKIIKYKEDTWIETPDYKRLFLKGMKIISSFAKDIPVSEFTIITDNYQFTSNFRHKVDGRAYNRLYQNYTYIQEPIVTMFTTNHRKITQSIQEIQDYMKNSIILNNNDNKKKRNTQQIDGLSMSPKKKQMIDSDDDISSQSDDDSTDDDSTSDDSTSDSADEDDDHESDDDSADHEPKYNSRGRLMRTCKLTDKSPPAKASKSPQAKASKSPPAKASKSPPAKASKSPPAKASKSPPAKANKSPPVDGETPTVEASKSPMSINNSQILSAKTNLATANVYDLLDAISGIKFEQTEDGATIIDSLMIVTFLLFNFTDNELATRQFSMTGDQKCRLCRRHLESAFDIYCTNCRHIKNIDTIKSYCKMCDKITKFKFIGYCKSCYNRVAESIDSFILSDNVDLSTDTVELSFEMIPELIHRKYGHKEIYSFSLPLLEPEQELYLTFAPVNKNCEYPNVPQTYIFKCTPSLIGTVFYFINTYGNIKYSLQLDAIRRPILILNLEQ